jgi:hypothetical protein
MDSISIPKALLFFPSRWGRRYFNRFIETDMDGDVNASHQESTQLRRKIRKNSGRTEWDALCTFPETPIEFHPASKGGK